jgi:TetR/AcrR family transcriptional repressor of nem operon
MAKNTRETLLDYTFDEIHQYGYFQASTSDILKKCKIPKGSMYHYFSSKHDLTLAVIKERVLPKTLKNYHINVSNSPFESLITFLESIDFSKKAFKYGCIMHKLIVEMSHLDEGFKKELSAVYEKVVAHFEEILNLALKEGEIKKCDTKEKANYIFVVLLGVISLKNEVARDTLIRELRLLKSLKKAQKPPRQQSLF